MNPENTKNVSNIGRNDPEAIARAAGVLEVTEPESVPSARASERRGVLGTVAGGLGVVGLAAWALLPRGEQPPAPQPESFEAQVQESAQVPYDPSTDELVIDGIKVKPANGDANTPSEAVLSHPQVQEYVATNPDESSSITASALSLPSTESTTYAVVERDVDGDGDTDAVAVPSPSKQ